eukprot:3033517-Prymnesium_polylepis.1
MRLRTRAEPCEESRRRASPHLLLVDRLLRPIVPRPDPLVPLVVVAPQPDLFAASCAGSGGAPAGEPAIFARLCQFGLEDEGLGAVQRRTVQLLAEGVDVGGLHRPLCVSWAIARCA